MRAKRLLALAVPAMFIGYVSVRVFRGAATFRISQPAVSSSRTNEVHAGHPEQREHQSPNYALPPTSAPNGDAGRTSTVPTPEPPRFRPRPSSEWQGMPVDLSLHPPCEGSTGCGLARACVNGTCGPCSIDKECGAGEACVLDHCVMLSNVGCRSRRDCPAAEAVCVLGGYSSDARGNGTMHSACVSPGDAVPTVLLPQEAPIPSSSTAVRDPTDDELPVGEQLVKALRARRGSAESPDR